MSVKKLTCNQIPLVLSTTDGGVDKTSIPHINIAVIMYVNEVIA